MRQGSLSPDRWIRAEASRPRSGHISTCFPYFVDSPPGCYNIGASGETPTPALGSPSTGGLPIFLAARSRIEGRRSRPGEVLRSALGKSGQDPGHVACRVLEVDDPDVLVGAVGEGAGRVAAGSPAWRWPRPGSPSSSLPPGSPRRGPRCCTSARREPRSPPGRYAPGAARRAETTPLWPLPGSEALRGAPAVARSEGAAG